MNRSDFTIVGGGIAGLTTAIALRRVGLDARVFEAAPTPRAAGAGLALAANAMQAFERLGLTERITAVGRVLDSFTIYDEQGGIIAHTDSRAVRQRYGLDNFTVHRAALHRVLLAELGDDAVTTNKKAQRFEQDAAGLTLHFADGSTHRTRYLLVADGVHSPLRRQVLPNYQPRYAGYTCWRAVVNSAGLDFDGASETWGTKGRFGLVPLADGLLYWFACVNAPANDVRLRQFTPADLVGQFRGYPEPIGEAIGRADALLWNDILDLKPLPHYAFGPVVLLGDAAHATTPNLGQGACQAIEDAVVLADELRRGGAVEAAFARFERRRLQRTHTITETSRRLGRVAQTENRVLASLRNFALRRIPARVNEKQLEMLYRVDF